MLVPMNLCRQIQKEEVIGKFADDPELVKSKARMAVKFLLPNNGLLIDDKEYRAIAETPLHLPYPLIALEFTHNMEDDQRGGEVRVPFVVICEEVLQNGIRWIAIAPVMGLEHKQWAVIPTILLEADTWLRERATDGRLGLNIATDDRAPIEEQEQYSPITIAPLLNLLNALACSNITVADQKPNIKATKGRLPFDSYKVLMVETSQGGSTKKSLSESRRGPREHLRRGHIRVLPSGKKIWINVMVVAKGKGGGTIYKDYQVR